MNTSSGGFNGSLVEDFYPSLTENNPARLVAWSFSLISTLVAPPLLCFVVWFERYGNDAKRTLINILVSAICCTIALFSVISQPIN